MVYRGMCTYIPKVKAIHVRAMSRQSDENCHRSLFLVQWQFSYEETVKHVLADEMSFLPDIIS